MGFVNALKAAADFAKSVGEDDSAANYLSVA
jgi:GH15 family glucan-1,4-alpha-glucosidase